MTEPVVLTVRDVRAETADAATIVLEDPEGRVGGTAGQHVVLHASIDGDMHRRVYSLSSSPELGQAPSITVKRLADGVVSPWLVDGVRPGDRLAVEPAAGVFTVDIDPSDRRTYYGFVAGSGSVPVVSIVQTILARQPGSNVHLAYGNRTPKDVIFAATLEDLVGRHPDRLSITHVFSGEGRRIDPRFVNDFLMSHPPITPDLRYLVSGPPGMRDMVAARLASLGAPDEHVLVEYYLPPERTEAPEPFDGAVVRAGDVDASVPAGHTILDALAAAGAPVEWACRSGVCGTCRARVVSGEIDAGFPFILTDAERAAGAILTCIARPLSPEVVVELE